MVAGEDSQNCGLTIQVWNDDAQIKELEQQPEAVEAAGLLGLHSSSDFGHIPLFLHDFILKPRAP